jgi:hypothetical protein
MLEKLKGKTPRWIGVMTRDSENDVLALRGYSFLSLTVDATTFEMELAKYSKY